MNNIKIEMNSINLEKTYVFDYIALDHERKNVVLNLTHTFNPYCLGCQKDLKEAKQWAKKLGYSLKIREPLFLD